jgi:hypothetical protein
MATLYAWAVPAWFNQNLLDHTWVTAYNNQTHSYANVSQVIAANQNYWFCWGGYHAKGGIPLNPTGALGKQIGALPLARCLVKPNLETRPNPPAQGTIFTYGVDGVCHQLANQVLYSTGSSSVAPLTVRKARGYASSSFLYGTYGLQHAAWRAKIQGCGGTAHPKMQIAKPTGTAFVIDLPDDFERYASEILSDDPEVLRELLNLRTEVQTYSAVSIPGYEPPDAAALNTRNQHFLNQAALLLGEEKFERLFGFKAGQTMDLVDPEMTEKK